MPWRDGTGPRWGGGPGAGRRMGPCPLGRGFWGYCGPKISKEDYVEGLKREIQALQQEIKDLEKDA